MPPDKVTIDASTIFSAEDYHLYCMWNAKFGDAENTSEIVSSLDYHEFLLWRSIRLPSAERTPTKEHYVIPLDPKYYIATVCGHPLHPEHLDVDYCPVCQVTMCLQLQDAIAKVWMEEGGSRTGKYFALRSGFRRAKVELLDKMVDLQKLSVLEQEWDRAHASDTAQMDTYSATKALKLVEEKTQYPANIMSKTEFVKMCGRKPSEKKTATKTSKTVTFAPDTIDGSTRKQRYWKRDSLNYSPGAHACVSDLELVDTSFMKNSAYSLAGLEVYVVITDGSDEDFATLDPEKVLSEGPAVEHKLWKNILGVYQDAMRNENLLRQAEIRKSVDQSSRVLVIQHCVSKEVLEVIWGPSAEQDIKIEAEPLSWVTLTDCV